MKKVYINDSFPHFLHGGDYNPDQWQDYPEILEEDMRLMKLAHCNVMSVGIFAWATLEPKEGIFDFSYLDKAIGDIYANGGRVFLATPSGARPAWLSQKYPEVLRTNNDLSVNIHGGRHNHCYSSPIYRQKVAIINQKLSERYGSHPAVIGWHISNEYGGYCYCELCREEFRKWLKNKYKTLDALNKQYWTAFWGHTYSDWSQIDPPTVHGEKWTHGLTIDWKRFSSHQTIDFMKWEIAAVRQFSPNLPVTTNLIGFYNDIDYRELAKEVDFVSQDSYPAWRAHEDDIDRAAMFGMTYDMIRSLKHKPFVLMESAPGLVNWQPYNKLKRPGMHDMTSLQTVAHGSDAVMYFQWRKNRGSSEKFHGAVVDHVGHENTRVFREVAALGERLEKLEAILGTTTKSRVGLLYNWDNRWAVEDAHAFQRQDKKFFETVQQYYRPLWKRGINVDVIGNGDDFSKYDLIIAPQHYVVSAELENKMESFVKEGGTLLCTYMTGMVNENDLVHLGGFPAGKLKDVFGLWNEEIDTLYPDEKNVVAYAGSDYDAVDYCELVHPSTATVLATYSTDFYKGMPAYTVNEYGKGKAYYVTFRDKDDFSDRIIGEILSECGIASDFDGELPHGVSAHSRTDGETLFVFLENYASAEKRLSTSIEWKKAEDGAPITGEITMAPYEILILTRPVEG